MKLLALDPATQCGFAHSCGASGTWDLRVRRDEAGGIVKEDDHLIDGGRMAVYSAIRKRRII